MSKLNQKHSHLNISRARSHSYGLAARAVPLFWPVSIEITCVPYCYFSGKSALPYRSKIHGYGPALIKLHATKS